MKGEVNEGKAKEGRRRSMNRAEVSFPRSFQLVRAREMRNSTH